MATNFFKTTPDRIQVIKGGVPIFDTNAKTFNRVTSEEVILTGQTITFPNFVNNTYGYFYLNGVGGGDACTTIGCIPPQEWSNAEPSPRTLADIVLGSLPIGTDYIEVIVNLARTTTPLAVFGTVTWPIDIIENLDIALKGGSCLVESQLGLQRLFDIVIVNTVVSGVITACDAVLRRKMSVTAQGIHAFLPGFATHQIDFRQGGGQFAGNTVQFGAGNACSIANTRNYQSVYTGTIRITPCCTVPA